MSLPARIALFGAACLLLPGLAAQPPAKTDDKKSTQSRIEKKTYDFKDAGKEMEYALFVPSTYDKGKKAPLVIALHGLGGTPQQVMRYRGLTDLAEKHGYVVAAPMGYNPRGWYGARVPAKGKKDDPENLAALSEKDVMNVLDIVKKDYAIDPDRVYLMGHSMGGGGTWHLAIKYPDQWAALAPIAPAVFRPAADVQKIRHVPVILVQGDKDELVPVAGARRWAEQMKKLGMTHEYVEVAGGDHVAVAAQNLPKIFEFFDEHKRGGKADEKQKDGEKGKAAPRRNVAVFVHDGVELLDFAGPGEVFAAAGGGGAFRVYTVAASRDPVVSQGFLKVTPEFTFADCPKPDVIVLPGGATGKALRDPGLVEWVRKASADAEVTLSVCTGAFILAKAGLLDGKEATTHWASVESLKKEYPKTKVHADRRFVDSGRVVTAAGVSAGIAAALHVVGRLLGEDDAKKTARYMEYKWSPAGDGGK